MVARTLTLCCPPPVLTCWRIKIDLSLLSDWWHDTRPQVSDLHGRYTSHLPLSLQTGTIGATPPSTVTHSQLCLSVCPVTLLSCRLTSLQPVKPSWPYSTQKSLYIRRHYALLPWRTNSGMNPQVIPVRHSQQSVTPSTSSVSTAQHTLCKVGLASSYPARSRYARQLLGLSSPTDAPLAICADTS